MLFVLIPFTFFYYYICAVLTFFQNLFLTEKERVGACGTQLLLFSRLQAFSQKRDLHLWGIRIFKIIKLYQIIALFFAVLVKRCYFSTRFRTGIKHFDTLSLSR